MAAPALPPRGTKQPSPALPVPPAPPKESFWKPVSDFFNSSKPPAPRLPPVAAPNGLNEVTAAFGVPMQVRRLEQESTKVPSYAVLTKRPIPPATPIVVTPPPKTPTPAAAKPDVPKPAAPKPAGPIRTKANTTFSGERRNLVKEGLAIKDKVKINDVEVTLSYVPEAEQPGGVKNAVFPEDISNYQRENTILIGNHTLKICFTDFISSMKEVIVNAANKQLAGGTGVDGAVHAAGTDAQGNEWYGIEHKHLQYDFNGTFTEGYAAIIPDMTMRSQFYNDKTNQKNGPSFEVQQSVIVVAGPNEQPGAMKGTEASRNNELYLCYRHAMELAFLHGKKSIAFPPIAIGIFKFNKERAAACAMKAVKDFFEAHPNAELDISIHHFLPNTVRKDADIKDWNDYQRVAAQFPNSYDVLYRDRDLKELTQKLGQFTGKLQTNPGLAAPINQPRPHFDLGSGAVNSALQLLTHTFWQCHPKVQAIAGQDLSWGPHETYESLEARMQSFAPIGDSKPERVLFKWSYFVYLKALQSGSDQQVKEALILHHQICYAIGQKRDPKFVPTEVADYLDLWSEMMGIQVATEGAKPSSNKTQGVLRISTATDASFLDAVKREFAEKRIVGKSPNFVIVERSQEKALSFGNEGSYFQTPLDLSGYFKDAQPAHYTLMGFTHVQPGGHRLAYAGKIIEPGKAQWFKCHDMNVEKVEKFDNAPVERAEVLIFAKIASPK